MRASALILLAFVGCGEKSPASMMMGDIPADGETITHADSLIFTGHIWSPEFDSGHAVGFDPFDPDHTLEHDQSLRAVWKLEGETVCEAASNDRGMTECEIQFVGKPQLSSQVVSLEAHGPNGLISSARRTYQVTPNAEPEVSVREAATRYYADQPYVFEVLTSDADGDELLVEYRIDGGEVQEARWDGDIALIDIPPLNQGTHPVQIRVTDGYASVLVSKPLQIGPPNGAPTCFIAEPDDGKRYLALDLTQFAALVRDDEQESDDLIVEYTVNGNAFATPPPGSDGSIIGEVPPLNDGLAEFRIYAEDDGGKSCEAVSVVEMSSENYPPTVATVEVSPMPAIRHQPVFVCTTVTDLDDPPEDLIFRVDFPSGAAVGVPDATGKVCVSWTPSGPGSYDISWAAEDRHSFPDGPTGFVFIPVSNF